MTNNPTTLFRDLIPYADKIHNELWNNSTYSTQSSALSFTLRMFDVVYHYPNKELGEDLFIDQDLVILPHLIGTILALVKGLVISIGFRTEEMTNDFSEEVSVEVMSAFEDMLETLAKESRRLSKG